MVLVRSKFCFENESVSSGFIWWFFQIETQASSCGYSSLLRMIVSVLRMTSLAFFTNHVDRVTMKKPGIKGNTDASTTASSVFHTRGSCCLKPPFCHPVVRFYRFHRRDAPGFVLNELLKFLFFVNRNTGQHLGFDE